MNTFAELQLSPQILRAVQEMGYETPSPIQQQALPILLGESTDFLGLAGTGTGKTAAFAIPLLERIDAKKRAVQSLILCPTRELALQVAGQIDLLGKYKGIRSVTVYGGAPFGDQVRGLKAGAQIVVGTPGRVIDHLERKTLNLSDVNVLVLDEADEMFSMGFKEELDTILAGVPKDQSNTWLFSATMSREVRRTVETNLHEPKTVQVNRTAMLATGVEQYFYRAQENEKPEMICKLIEAADDFYGLIFCQTKALVADLTRFMLDRGYKVDCLHGDMDQNSRERTMQAFRDKKLSVLICTDVAARGLDVKDITHVVNYSLPREMESYVHRIGRTARSGKTGIVMNLLTFSHRHLLGRIEAHTKVRMKEGFVPSKREIAAKKVARVLATFSDQPFASRVSEVMGEEFREKLATMTQEEVATHFIVMMMPDIFGGAESRKTKKAVRTSAAPVASVPVEMSAPVVSSIVPTAVVVTAPVLEPIDDETSIDDAIVAAEAITEPVMDIFGDEIAEPKKRTSIDEPPRARASARPRKPTLSEDEISSLLDEPTPFGVVKSQPERSTPARKSPTRSAAVRSAPVRSAPVRSASLRSERPSRPEGFSRPERTSRPSREGVRAERPGRDSFAPRSQSQFRKAPVTRPDGMLKSLDHPVVRPAAPANFAKPPKHEAGPARTAREGETGQLNRRARRAALFGRALEGAPSDASSTSSN